MERPFGVTVLAALEYTGAACLLAFGLVAITGAEPLAKLLNSFSRSHPLAPGDISVGLRVTLGAICISFAPLAYVMARDMWKLRKRARTWTIVFCGIDVILGGSGFHSRIIAALTILYLLIPSVKAAFQTKPSRDAMGGITP